jgi:hypothetical protein
MTPSFPEQELRDRAAQTRRREEMFDALTAGGHPQEYPVLRSSRMRHATEVRGNDINLLFVFRRRNADVVTSDWLFVVCRPGTRNAPQVA